MARSVTRKVGPPCELCALSEDLQVPGSGRRPFGYAWGPSILASVIVLTIFRWAVVCAIEANAVAIPDMDTGRFEQEDIRALFTGIANDQGTKVLIQQFSGRQVLSRRFSLLQDGNAFRRLSDSAFTFDSSLTGIAEGERLKFKSFHKMRGIVDLSDIYRAATDQEVRNFVDHATIEVARPEEFLGLADQTMRKLVHAITRSGTLDRYDVNQIRTAAAAVEMPMDVVDGKVVMPTERRAIKTFLQFLDDGLYRASLTGQRYVTNSKRARPV